MNSIVERLRIPGDEVFSTRKKWQLADLIEQQAERIKDLESAADTYKRGYRQVVAERNALHGRIKELEAELLSAMNQAEHNGNELAALRQRINDAPVVAWLHEVRQDSDVITNAVKHVWGGVAVGKEAQYTIPLISKEDLQNES